MVCGWLIVYYSKDGDLVRCLPSANPGCCYHT